MKAVEQPTDDTTSGKLCGRDEDGANGGCRGELALVGTASGRVLAAPTQGNQLVSQGNALPHKACSLVLRVVEPVALAAQSTGTAGTLAGPARGSSASHREYLFPPPVPYQQLEKFPQQTELAAWSGASGGIPEHNKILFFQGEGELNKILYFLVEPELNRNLVRSGYRNSTGTYRNLPSTGTYQSSGTLPPRDAAF